MRTAPLLLAVVTTAATTLAEATEAQRTVVVFSGPTMGTRYTVRVAGPLLDDRGREDIRAAIDLELELANRLMSTWNPDSEISRFNRHLSTQPFAMTPETLSVLDVARQVSELTEGALDVTVAPLVEAWGFGPAGRTPRPPSPAELEEIRKRVGFRLLRLDLERGTVAKVRPDVSCDLSALVPGWAADRIAAALGELGHGDVIVDIGGEVVARGRRADGARWRVAVESPEPGALLVLELEDQSVATSGDYRNSFRDADGNRRSHLLDPRTGEPVTHGLASVTVAHPEAKWADALATALLVMGPEAGTDLATRQHLAARFVVRRADGTYTSAATPEFQVLGLAQAER